MDTRLVVIQDEESTVEPSTSDRFAIESSLRSASRDEWSSVYYTLALFRPDSTAEVPIYESMWKHFVVPPMSEGEGSVGRAVLLYRQLEARIEATDPAEIVCRAVDRPTDRAVVRDVAAAHDVPVRGIGDPEPSATLWTFLTAMVGLVPFFLDQLLSLLVRQFVDRPERSDTLFVPAVGRFESMRPVLDEATMEYTVLATPLTLRWYLSDPVPEMRRYDPVPINLFTSLETIVRQLRFCLLDLGRDQVLGGELVDEIDSLLREELDVAMPTAVASSVAQLHQSNVYRRLLLATLLDRAIDELNASQVAVGTESMMGRAMMATAVENGCQAYQIPHSIANEYFAPIVLDRTIFLPSSLLEGYLTDSVPSNARVNEDDAVAVGRPYLAELDRWRRANDAERTDETLRIVLATQPQDDRIQDEFRRVAFGAIEQIDRRSDRPVEVVIKIHPNENPESYDSVGENLDFPVRIAETDLWQHLRDADLVFTVNSNVGIEAIIAKTPCICFNFWYPLLYDHLFARRGPIPVLRSPDAVRKYFEDFDPDSIPDLLAEQESFVRDQFVLEPTSAEAIAAKMASDLEATRTARVTD